ncbi:hypothetical protein JOF28_000509 [Leucobacter exalbidus]|uniref:Uncharacterized protein n=1 Tax=Leucobacter exalbidus TaxID=662960 RepID=A0A940T2N9_9MICO|nr:Fe-S oxidoreductase [Leucobacter exalbidus]MBP1325277.1 hypothetical protein [Leucobacter exalbidus]
MQLGARWRAGDAPHRGVPPVLFSAIAEQEAVYPSASSWTLTFLEGRPRCALDDAVIVTLDAHGDVALIAVHTLDDAATNDAATTGGATGNAAPPVIASDDDDDDWLS